MARFALPDLAWQASPKTSSLSCQNPKGAICLCKPGGQINCENIYLYFKIPIINIECHSKTIGFERSFG